MLSTAIDEPVAFFGLEAFPSRSNWLAGAGRSGAQLGGLCVGDARSASLARIVLRAPPWTQMAMGQNRYPKWNPDKWTKD